MRWVAVFAVLAATPAELQNQAVALAGCIAGAAPVDDVRVMLAAARSVDVDVKIAPCSAEIVGASLPGIERFIASATIEARRPGAARARARAADPGAAYDHLARAMAGCRTAPASSSR